MGVRLRPGVAYLLARTPICQIVNRREPLARFLGACADELAKQMAKTTSSDARFDLLEAFCLEQLAGKAVHECVGMALRLLEESAGAMQIREVARRCAVSQRQLERLLRAWVGMSPKRLARIARFQTVLGRAERNGSTIERRNSLSLLLETRTRQRRSLLLCVRATSGLANTSS